MHGFYVIIGLAFLALIQVSQATQKKKSQGLLIVPKCMGKRVSARKYSDAIKACKGKKTEMCTWMCMAEKMSFVKSGHIMHKEQKDYAKDILPKEAVDPVMDFIVACRKHFKKDDKSSDCDGNLEWIKCNKKAEINGCKKAEKKSRRRR